MGLLFGSVTYKKFRVEDELGKDFKETLIRQLPRYAFREIDPQINPEWSIGWVNALDPADSELGLEKALFGKYIILGLRKDHKSVSAALFKARFSQALRAYAREHRGRKFSRQETASLKETVKAKMLAEASPTTSLHEMVWNYETQEVYFSSHASKISSEFADLFQETFGLSLAEQTLVTRAEAFVEAKGLGLELIDLQAANFGG